MNSDEANSFIRGHHLKGKPLEVQYERTREGDMNGVERQLFISQDQFKLLVKKQQRQQKKKKIQTKKVSEVEKIKKIRSRKQLTKKDMMRRQLGFI